MTHPAGIFDWSNQVMDRLDQANIPGCISIRGKQFVIIGYYLELGYELMIAANRDVSQNPGFESYLGIYSNATD